MSSTYMLLRGLTNKSLQFKIKLATYYRCKKDVIQEDLDVKDMKFTQGNHYHKVFVKLSKQTSKWKHLDSRGWAKEDKNILKSSPPSFSF